jgi:hypothetical protein
LVELIDASSGEVVSAAKMTGYVRRGGNARVRLITEYI